MKEPIFCKRNLTYIWKQFLRNFVIVFNDEDWLCTIMQMNFACVFLFVNVFWMCFWLYFKCFVQMFCICVFLFVCQMCLCVDTWNTARSCLLTCCICICRYMYTHTQTHTHTHTHTYTQPHSHTHTHKHTHTQVCVYTYICIFVYVYVCIYNIYTENIHVYKTYIQQNIYSTKHIFNIHHLAQHTSCDIKN